MAAQRFKLKKLVDIYDSQVIGLQILNQHKEMERLSYKVYLLLVVAFFGFYFCQKSDTIDNERQSIRQKLMGTWVSDESCKGCYELLIKNDELILFYAPTISIEPETMNYELKDGNAIQTYRKWYGHEMTHVEHGFTFGEDGSLTIDNFVLTLVGFGSARFVRAESSNE